MLLTAAFSAVAYLTNVVMEHRGTQERAWVPLTAFEKQKVTQQKNHKSYEFLKLNDAHPIRSFSCPKAQTLRFIPTFVVNCLYEGEGERKKAWKIKMNRFNLEKIVLYQSP